VFLEWIPKSGGVVPQATVYDARFSQMMKVIPYPKTVTNVGSEQAQITQYFTKKISPYLGKDSISYWSKNIDQDAILDHRIGNRMNKPIHKRPEFWAIGLGVLVAGTVTAVVLSQNGGSSPSSGGVTVNFGGN